ncbi:MAG: hypothetical protein ACTSRE_16360 [Promethearchaeota archaeon]
METKTMFKKRDILRHFLSAGINVSPKALGILASKPLSNQDLEELNKKMKIKIPIMRYLKLLN